MAKKIQAELVKDDVIEIDVSEEKIYKCIDSEWSEFILDQLADHELVQGKPTTDGLRRVTEKVFGTILESDTEIVQITDSMALAKHTLVIARYDTNQVIKVSACVDVLRSSLPSLFSKHMASTACTRAEGKALRRALKIRVVTAEETQSTDDDASSVTVINDQQIMAINVLCKRLDIDVEKMLKKQNNKLSTIKTASNLEGQLVMNQLSKYQKNPSDIEPDIVGYNINWRETFGGE